MKVYGEPDLVLESVDAFRIDASARPISGILAGYGLLIAIGWIDAAIDAYEDPAAFLKRVGNPR